MVADDDRDCVRMWWCRGVLWCGWGWEESDDAGASETRRGRRDGTCYR
jgi:hypothetical protein